MNTKVFKAEKEDKDLTSAKGCAMEMEIESKPELTLEVEISAGNDVIKGSRFERPFNINWDTNIYGLCMELISAAYAVYTMKNRTKLTYGGGSGNFYIFKYKKFIDELTDSDRDETAFKISYDEMIEKFKPKFTEYLGSSIKELEGKIFFKQPGSNFQSQFTQYVYGLFEKAENLDILK